MLHLRVVAAPGRAGRVRELLRATPSVYNVVALGRVAEQPPGEVFLCDVADEDADLLIGDLQDLGVPQDGSIAIQSVELEISRRAGGRADAVRGRHTLAWENVEAQAFDATEVSASFLAFIVLAMFIAASGILLDTPILIVGAMILGPDFGPLAGTCVAALERRPGPTVRSLGALLGGFAFGGVATLALVLVLRAAGLVGPALDETAGQLTPAVAQVAGPPGFFTFFVAACAGIAGMLSLSSSKSGALIGVLVSVTTVPAAANVALAGAYGEWATALGSLEQLLANLATMLLAGMLTLIAQRRATLWRRARRQRPAGAGAPQRERE